MVSHRAAASRRHRLRAVAVATLGAIALPLVGLTTPLVPANAAGSGSAFSQTKTISRDHVLVDGVPQHVDTRTVKVNVSATTNLRNRQTVTVTWSGARPTSGIVGDQTSTNAGYEEYPVVIMQCRGVDSTSVPAAQRISPETCWTQTPSERFQADPTPANQYPPFRVDRYGTAADRQLKAGAPVPYPTDPICQSTFALPQHWVPFRAADGKVYPGGPQACAGAPPEATSYGDSSVPNNTTYGVTESDGTGSASFVIQTADANASEGCSVTVKCSIVVVPIMGVSCDVTTAPAEEQEHAAALCTKPAYFAPGDRTPGDQARDKSNQTLTGNLWWSASNWRNRIAAPITIAPSASACAVDNETPMYVYGSELMTPVMNRWQPYFCTTKGLFDVQHVQTGEPAAKNLLRAGAINAAFEARPPDDGYPRPIAHAPVAYTGFVIGFRIDDALGRPVTTLKLTPRLLAKLLTQSYPGNLDGYKALAGNPISIDVDPEFRALNPKVPTLSETGSGNLESAQTLLALSSESDVMHALTSYIAADPDARAWLNGTPDPWKMKVNPNYTTAKLGLPVQRWPLLDSYIAPAAQYTDICKGIIVPWMGLVASPVSALATATLDLQFAINTSQTKCVGTSDAPKFTNKGRQATGKRFVLGVTSLGDAKRYSIPTAALETGSGDKTFVAPTTTSLKNSAALLKFDKATGTWPIPYAKLRTSAGANAYPGATLISMDVPTEGLAKTDAAKYAKFLRFAASTGQKPGTGNGQLPDGYLPLTAANNLGALADYTDKTATTVQTQNGQYAASGGGGGDGGSSGGTGGSGGGTGTGGTGTATDTGTGSTTPDATPDTAKGGATPNTDAPVTALSTIRTIGALAGVGGMLFPGFLLLAVLCGVAAPVTVYVGRRTAR